jgi:perosamine synthetase
MENAGAANGALYKGKKAGSLSDIGVFSFFANKNITTGEGGMMVTANSSYAQKAKYYKNLCFPTDGKRTYLHEEIGFNYRLSNLHAALGLAQVEKADEYKEMRIKNAALYRQSLANVPGIVFQQYDAGIYENVFWMNAVKIDPKLFGLSRDQLVSFLSEQGIETRTLFNGMHRQQALIKYGCDTSGLYPVSDELAENGLYLPSASHLSKDSIKFICETISKAQKDNKK